MLLHGYGSSGARQDGYMQFSALADHYGYLFFAPDGNQENGGSSNRYWNASEACCDFFGGQQDGAAYIMALIEEVRKRYSIDPDRSYLVRHSNGGFMSYRIAQEYSTTIAYGGDAIPGKRYPGAPETVERWAGYNGFEPGGLSHPLIRVQGQFPRTEINPVPFPIPPASALQRGNPAIFDDHPILLQRQTAQGHRPAARFPCELYRQDKLARKGAVE